MCWYIYYRLTDDIAKCYCYFTTDCTELHLASPCRGDAGLVCFLHSVSWWAQRGPYVQMRFSENGTNKALVDRRHWHALL